MTDLLTTTQMCNRLQVSRMTLWRLVKAGHIIPVYITDSLVRYPATEIDRLVAASAAALDDEAILRTALRGIAEAAAEDERPMCTGCGRRRSSRNGGPCSYCADAEEIDRMHKRDWWNRNKPSRTTIDGKRVYLKPGETREQAAARVAS